MGKSEGAKLKLRKSYPFAHPRQIPRQKNTHQHLNIIKNKGKKNYTRIDLRQKKEEKKEITTRQYIVDDATCTAVWRWDWGVRNQNKKHSIRK